MYAQAMARSSTAAISMMGTGLVLIKMISMKGVYNIFACREPRGFCIYLDASNYALFVSLATILNILATDKLNTKQQVANRRSWPQIADRERRDSI